MQGSGHAALAGLAACAVGTAVGVAVSLAVPIHHKLVGFALAIPAAGFAIVAFGVVAYFLDDGDLKAVLAWVRRVVRVGSAAAPLVPGRAKRRGTGDDALTAGAPVVRRAP